MNTTSNYPDDHGPREGVATPVLVIQQDASKAPVKTWLRRRAAILFVGIAIVIFAGLNFYWSSEPDTFDVISLATVEVGRDPADLTPGAFTTAALLGVSRTLLNKPGGYLRNDVTPPALWMDNMPSWERGVVVEIRDSVRALRNDFSRAQTQSGEIVDLVKADAQFHFDDAHWILPATEDEFQAGIDSLRSYLDALHRQGAGRAQFYVRADNLNFFLATVEKRLGSYAQQLAGNVLDLNAAGITLEPGGPANAEATPWLEVDNVFYEARGYIWALLHTLRGIERDFTTVLGSKAAGLPLREIIAKLEQTQATVWSPVILNNSGFGLLTNHSLVMASYISRANAAIIDLRLLLSEG